MKKLILSLILLMSLNEICYSQNLIDLKVWSVGNNGANVFYKINEKIKDGEVMDSIDLNNLEGLKANLITTTTPNVTGLPEITENDIIVIAFWDKTMKKYTSLGDAGIDKITFEMLQDENRSTLFDVSITSEDTNLVFKVINFKGNKTQFDILKSKPNGTYIDIKTKSNRIRNGLSYLQLFRTTSQYSPIGIGNIIGFWLPVGLFSLGKENDQVLLTGAPISLAFGTKWNQNANPDDYLGFSIFVNYSLTETEDKKFINSLSMGPIIDIYNYLYLGYNFNVKTAQDNTSKKGFLFGIGPRLLNIFKGLGL